MVRSAGKPVSQGRSHNSTTLMKTLVVKLFLSGLGGSPPIIFWIGWIAGLALCELLDVVGTWWVGYWARQYAATDPSTVPVF